MRDSVMVAVQAPPRGVRAVRSGDDVLWQIDPNYGVEIKCKHLWANQFITGPQREDGTWPSVCETCMNEFMAAERRGRKDGKR